MKWDVTACGKQNGHDRFVCLDPAPSSGDVRRKGLFILNETTQRRQNGWISRPILDGDVHRRGLLTRI
jgi:hypothetical protein